MDILTFAKFYSVVIAAAIIVVFIYEWVSYCVQDFKEFCRQQDAKEKMIRKYQGDL